MYLLVLITWIPDSPLWIGEWAMAAGGSKDDAFPRFSLFFIDGVTLSFSTNPDVDTPVLVREERPLAPPKLFVCSASHSEPAASFAFRS